MKIIAVIPARGGSKGVPGKNIKPLGGKPLISYTIESALQSKLLNKIVVSSDSEDILSYARQFKGIDCLERPLELAQDVSSSIDVVKHVIAHYDAIGEHYNAICLLQATSPFRSNSLIDLCITKFIKAKADSLITIRTLDDKFNPHWIFEEDGEELINATHDTELITRRQDLPNAYYRDGKVYLSSRELLSKNKLVGGKITGYINDDELDVNIDTFADWEKAENVILNNKNK